MAYLFTSGGSQGVKYIQNHQLDGFGRLRVGNIKTLFDSTLKHNSEDFLWDTMVEGTGSSAVYDNVERMVHLSVSGNGDHVCRQTREYFQYQSGKSHIGVYAGLFGETPANVVKRMGFYDDKDGIALQYDTTLGISILYRSSISGVTEDINIPQTYWNIDKLDGTGPSKITLDPTKMQVFFIDFSWTGIGQIRLGVFINGLVQYFHSLERANIGITNSLSAQSVPCRYEITSTGGVSEMKQQASAVLIEGDYSPRGINRSVNTGTSALNVGSSLTVGKNVYIYSHHQH